MSTDIELQQVHVIDLTSASSGQTIYTTDLPESGAVAGDGVSNNVAALVNLSVGIRKRGANGRVFIPGLAEVATDGQVLAATQATNLQNWFEDLQAALLALDPPQELTVVSYYDNGILREAGLPRPVLAFNPSNQLASQKLRLHGRKRKKRTP
jgi:hypothetical protein